MIRYLVSMSFFFFCNDDYFTIEINAAVRSDELNFS